MKKNHGGLNTSAMPSKLSTLVSKISAIPTYDNAKIIDEFYHYMKEGGASEKHLANNLQNIISNHSMNHLHQTKESKNTSDKSRIYQHNPTKSNTIHSFLKRYATCA
jgi:hypothetical protein